MGKSRQRQERQYFDHIDSTKKKHPPDKDGCKGKRNVLLWRTAGSSSPKGPQIRHPRGPQPHGKHRTGLGVQHGLISLVLCFLAGIFIIVSFRILQAEDVLLSNA